MAVALSEFWSRLVRNGLTDANGCKQYAAQYALSNNGSPPSNAVSLAKYLVQCEEITPFQAKALVADDAITLRLGRYLIRDEKTPSPLGNWVTVVCDRPIDAKKVDVKKVDGFLFRNARPNETDSNDGYSDRVNAHAKVQARSLQPLQIESIGDLPVVFSPLPQGACLFECLSGGGRMSIREPVASRKGLPRKQVYRIAIAIADALHSLHRESLYHGSVRIDRIWITKQGDAILLRDLPNWLDTLESPRFYAAPEQHGEPALTSVATDIYSLGCLIYRLSTGRFPYESDSESELRALHQTTIPEDVVQAVEQGVYGNPLLRVIAYAIAKDPKSRFENADQFAKALRVAESMPDSVPLPMAKSAVKPPVSALAPAMTQTPAARQTPAAPIASVAPKPRVTTTQPIQTASRRRRRRRVAPFVLGGLGLVVLMLVIALLVGGPAQTTITVKKRTRPVSPSAAMPPWKPPTSRPQTAEAEPESQEEESGYTIVDDPKLLWEPPYPSNDSASLSMLPPGPGVILVVNLPPPGTQGGFQRIVEAFSPDLNELIEAAAQRAKVPVDSIARLAVALHRSNDSATGEGWPQCSLAVTLRTPMPLAQLVDSWGAVASRTAEGATIYASDQLGVDAYYVNAGDQQSGGPISQFSVGSIDRISEVAEFGGSEISLSRNLKSLWDATSPESDLAVLVTPNFLFSDARAILKTAAPRWESHLKSLLIPDVAAAMFTATFADAKFYAELRFSPSGGVSSPVLMQRMRQAIDATPAWAEDFILDSVPDASWRLLANRLPTMLRFVKDQSRFGVIDQTAIGNVYLPENAAAQVSLAAALAMNTMPSQTEGVGPMPAKVLTFDELLNQEISVAFDQESLQFGVDIIVEQLAASLPDGTDVPEVRIVGGDLQKMGITQNQQIRGFNKVNLPFRTILTDLLLGANPDKTATGSHDPKQALIWVVSEGNANGGKNEILITTRQAADGRYELPSEFK
ncbi:Serine/threonine-protein kinase PknH [Novipirellula aureliae]|uniref:Serine/threonine-protein kinase PknH n=1 Tax=Novipirellula aureliae TaxID=2527966 RepID=A0A5C6E8Q4_9BACT|nr:hypothetical protein [Novipirellula aureliae]TWU44081.1 Serine/threonine-protein kinase PknH [Novipirellula aureliae]